MPLLPPHPARVIQVPKIPPLGLGSLGPFFQGGAPSEREPLGEAACWPLPLRLTDDLAGALAGTCSHA